MRKLQLEKKRLPTLASHPVEPTTEIPAAVTNITGRADWRHQVKL